MSAIEEPSRHALRDGVAGPIAADAEHHLIAFAPLGDHLDQDLRRVLHVDVHRHYGLAARMLETGGDRRFLAEVARQRDGPDTWIAEVRGCYRDDGLVGAAVVDEEDFPIVLAHDPFEHF